MTQPRPLTRRRFLTISAMALALPARAEPIRWQAQAMGAQAEVTLHAPAPLAEQAIQAVQQEIARGEALFSLYDSASALVRLNRDGRLPNPDPTFCTLLRQCDKAHHLTGGAFDPTVQPLWQALATGGDTDAARTLIGWPRVSISADQITLAPGQALSLNGIAQGYVTDRVAARLRTLGLGRVLVNIGEFSALGGPWHLGIADPEWGLVATRTLTDRAIATSSSRATLVGGHSHILGRTAPLWSSVSVETNSAALADALSTGFALMPENAIHTVLPRLPGSTRVLLVTFEGETRVLYPRTA